ncbi:MAG: hypothetical protein AAGF84_06365 [Planctomycetota bacterium]
MKNLSGAIFGGVTAGLIGAAVWAGLIVFADIEIGWIAIGVGALVGFGVALGSRGGSPATGMVAALIAVLSIVGGKYAAVSVLINSHGSELVSEEMFADDVFVTSYVADDVLMEMGTEGMALEDLEWPATADFENPDGPEDYPADVWAEADRRWSAMSAEDQTAYRNEKQAMAEAGFAAMRGDLQYEAFKSMFGGLDLLFLGLAIFMAYKLGIAKIGDRDDTPIGSTGFD